MIWPLAWILFLLAHATLKIFRSCKPHLSLHLRIKHGQKHKIIWISLTITCKISSEMPQLIHLKILPLRLNFGLKSLDIIIFDLSWPIN